MAQTLIDIQNNILKFNGNKIIIIIDNNNIPWFSISGLAEILGYNNIRKVVIDRVDDTDKTIFDNLKQFVSYIPKNSQPNAVYINESGLYSLCLDSTKPIAKLFRQWITSDVLPSIRRTGYYSVVDEHKKELDKLNTKLKELRNENKILKFNQKKTKYDNGGLIYVVQPVDIINKKLKKAGKTTVGMNKRLYSYNTAVPNNMRVLFTIKVKDPDAVEHCMKSVLKPYIYRKNKEYYDCALTVIKRAINECISFIDGFHCPDCENRIDTPRHLLRHMKSAHDLDEDDNIVFKTFSKSQSIQQIGGVKTNVLCAVRHPKDKLFDDKTCINFMEPFFTIKVNDAEFINDYARQHLDPYFSPSNREYYECSLNDIQNVIHNCNSQFDSQIHCNKCNQTFVDLNVFIKHASEEYLLDMNKKFIFDILDYQKELDKSNNLDSQEKFELIKGGGFKCANGVIVLPNGKVILPNEYK